MSVAFASLEWIRRLYLPLGTYRKMVHDAQLLRRSVRQACPFQWRREQLALSPLGTNTRNEIR
jgi:hypothetical protein